MAKETVEIDGQQYEVTGRDHSGVPIIKGHATSVHHTDDDGNLLFDADGNPVKSVHVSVSPVSEPLIETGDNT